jgi:hypothetical protein
MGHDWHSRNPGDITVHYHHSMQLEQLKTGPGKKLDLVIEKS